MSTEYFKRASEPGYTKFSEIGQHMFNLLNTAKNLRNDLNVIFTFHMDKTIDSMTGEKDIKIKTIGKMLDQNYEPAASFTTLLYSTVEFDKDGKASYHFITNRTFAFPAKSPDGLFESIKIDNDLQYVIEKTREYYNED